LAPPSLPVLVVLFVLLIVSLSVHEAAHAWTANRLGDPTARLLGRLTVNPVSHIDVIGTIVFPLLAMLNPGVPILGWAKPVPVNPRNLRHPRRDFAIVAAAGPVSNLVMATVVAVAFHLLDAQLGYGEVSARAILIRFIVLNVSLAVFNVIPVPPLDGGNILAGFVPEPMARMIDALRPWGFIVLYLLLFAGVLDRFVTPVAGAVFRLLGLM
jgi:Zn-dependent protease